MYWFILFLGICSAFASGSKPPEKLPAKHLGRQPISDKKCEKIIGCYYTNNEDEQVDPTLNIEMIDFSICTHLFYSKAEFEIDASVQLTDGYTNIGENGGYERINNLRKKRHFKTLIAMEEANFDNKIKNDNKILLDPNLRAKLVDNVVNLVQKYEFNGIELNSQYLADNNVVASDKQNFVLLLKALKKKFDKKGLLLFLAVDFRESTAKKYDIKEISKYVNFINLKTYHYYGSAYDMEKVVKVGHTAPLYPSSKENTEDQKLNVEYTVKYWLSQHAPANKLILGTAFMGTSYTLDNPKQFGRNAPFLKDSFVGDESYYYICPWEKNRLWTTFWDKEQQVPYIHKGKEMFAYENAKSIEMKAEYAKKMNLGGVFADSIEKDDFGGRCDGEKFPLLKAISRGLNDKC